MESKKVALDEMRDTLTLSPTYVPLLLLSNSQCLYTENFGRLLQLLYFIITVFEYLFHAFQKKVFVFLWVYISIRTLATEENDISIVHGKHI